MAGAHLRGGCQRCAGALVTVQSAAAFRQSLTVFRNVAQYHVFELLAEVVEWLLELPSAGL